MLTDEEIIESWKNNIHPWVHAIENNEISTRVLVTNKAIIDAITENSPGTVLDLGCGEGWLVRELVARGIDTLGTDAIPDFIDYAKSYNIGRFKVLPYEKTMHSELNEKFDVIVCNFSLLGEKSVNSVFQNIPCY